MAPFTHHLVSLSKDVNSRSFIAALRGLPVSEKPLWVGQCHHWIHDPRLSVDALTGSGSELKKWDYLIFTKAINIGSSDLPSEINKLLSDKWSITAEVGDDYVDGLPGKEKIFAAAPVPTLSNGWSAENHASLDASEPPADVSLSLSTASPVMGQDKNESKVDIKTFVRNFGTSTPGSGPIVMFNLLSFFPGKMSEYFKYVEGFLKDLGPRTGAQPLSLGTEVYDWSSKEEDTRDVGVWELVALVWYPSIWHFGQMLGDEIYAKLDRDFKMGVVRDNPLICCTPVDLS